MMIIRHAATFIGGRGAQSCRTVLPVISASSASASVSKGGGVRRGLVAPSLKLKGPPALGPTTKNARQQFFSSSPKDKRLEAIEKSEQLHAELKEMIAAQKARQSEELQRPIGSNFLSFLKASKPEIVNIFFAFVCVLLAYQIHAMRAGIRKLQAEASDKEEEIARLRSILAKLVDSGEGVTDANNNTFSVRLANQCAEVVKRIFYESEKRVGYSWILGKKLASGDALEVENLIDQLQPVILSEMQSIVGDAAFTPEEIKERRVAALKRIQSDSSLDVSTQQSNGAGKRDAQMTDLMEILEDVHRHKIPDAQNAKSDEDGNDSSKVVRRTRYAI
ncbi:hypothetical protein ACHAWU_005445 [Discostella pseudostelligera]|uniref:Uncharacterized protein n=1 Tax=Discostella pseudostelligera TaxID=259834 RepID=A0ABD3MX67_9STRA